MGKDGFYILFMIIATLVGCQNPQKDFRFKHTARLEKTNPHFNNPPQNPFAFVPREKLKGEEILDYDFTQMSTSTIDSVLKVLYMLDQEYRIESVNARKRGDPAISIGKKMTRADSLNYHILSKIVEEIGWPDTRIYSDTAMSAPYLILLHARTTREGFEKFQSPLVEAFMTGKVKPDYYAVLVDEICLSMAMNQKFGTHCRYNANGPVDRYSMDDVSTVEKNRCEIGLDSLSLDWCELVKY